MRYQSIFYKDVLNGLNNSQSKEIVAIVEGYSQDVKSGFFKWILGEKGYLFIYKGSKKSSKLEGKK